MFIGRKTAFKERQGRNLLNKKTFVKDLKGFPKLRSNLEVHDMNSKTATTSTDGRQLKKLT